MKRSIFPAICAAIVLLQSHLLLSQSNTTMPNDYEAEWKAIDSLEEQGLPESAQKLTEDLLQKAKVENNAPQTIKALIYVNKFQAQREEDGLKNAIERWQQEMKAQAFPVRPIMQSLLAEMYQKYLDNNRWKFRNRTETTEEDPDDLATWSIDRIADKVAALYWASLEDEEKLAEEDIRLFAAITTEEQNTDELRPSLFDFLAHRAIEYFKNEQTYLTRPAEHFKVIDRAAFWDAPVFADHEFTTSDQESHKYQVLSLFQKLLKLRLADEDPAALIDADLARLRFLYEQAEMERRDEHYLAALQRLQEKFSDHNGAAEIAYQMAELFKRQGTRYQPSYRDEKNPPDDQEKWGYVKALNLCRKTMQDYPGTYGSEHCRQLAEFLEHRRLQLEVEQVSLPDQSILGYLSFRNARKVYFKVVRLSRKDQQKLDRDLRGEEALAFLKGKEPVRNWNETLPDPKDLHMHHIELNLGALPLGFYAIVFADNAGYSSTDGQVGHTFVQVSNIGFFRRLDHSYETEFLLVHRNSGAPLEGVKADFFQREYRRRQGGYKATRTGSVLSDSSGIVRRSKGGTGDMEVRFSLGEDELFLSDYFRHHGFGVRSGSREYCQFFLDRAIYRPGQTVYFKALLYQRNPEGELSILPNKSTTITFYDVNGQEVRNLELVSNQYGTVHGHFRTPQNGLTGRMSLRSSLDEGYKSFNVEEYKRPQFEVELLPFTEGYALGDTVELAGKAMAFAGSAIGNAKVSYRVEREAQYPWRRGFGWFAYPPPGSSTTVIAEGETATDEDGAFQLDFRALAGKVTEAWGSPLFLFTITVDVVDVTGETHSASRVVRLSEIGVHLGLDLPGSNGNFDRSEPFLLGVRTTNLDYQFVERQCTLKVVRLKGGNRKLIPRYWERPDLYKYDSDFYHKYFPGIPYKFEGLPDYAEVEEQVHEQVFTSGREMILTLDASSWPVGEYRVILKAEDDNGNEVESARQLTIFDGAAGKVPSGLTILAVTNKDSYEPGDVALINLLAEDTLNHVFFMVGRDSEVNGEEWLSFTGRTQATYEVTPEDRGGVYYQVNYVRNNREYTEVHKLPVPWTEKELKVELVSFRDKLKPGQEEEWRLRISGKEKDRVAAELLATMYDASLDAFAANYWNFFPFRQNGVGSLRWDAKYFSAHRATMYSPISPASSPINNSLLRSYREMDWFSFLRHGFHGLARTRGGFANAAMPMAEMAPAEADAFADESVAAESKAGDDSGHTPPPPTPPEPGGESSGETAAPPVRTNLDETVFFQPELYTDESGTVVIRFTMNEALTRWKFMAFAHTQDLKMGQITREVITQKDLMIQPNAPRFLREGDQLAFTAKISNLTERELSGYARLELFDAQTMQPVNESFGLVEPELTFRTGAGRSEALSWELKIPEGKVSALTYRVVAMAGELGDGEENALPVIPNRMLVTESMPLSIRGKENRRFSFANVQNSEQSSTLEPYRLTLELSSNPAWYAVQALPYLMEFPHECTEQVLNRLFANALASTVVGNQPAIRDLFESWKGTEALQSSLSKNAQLKSVLLEETPWVMQAQSEEQQKQQIGLLFDLQRMATEKDIAVEKLVQRQNPSGGFAWFPGGPESWYMTQYLVEGFGRLKEIGAMSNDFDPAAEMVGNAIGFIDSEIALYYQRISKKVEGQLTKWEDDHLTSIAVHYLYARSFYLDEMELDRETRKIFDFFFSQAEQYWLDKPLYQQAMIGLVAHRKRSKGLVGKIARSLKERSIRHEELGVHWQYNRGYHWDQLPVETHTMILEFFAETNTDPGIVEEMKIWLLKNKQTNHWKTTKATAAAIYALFQYGDNWLEASKPVKVLFENLPKSDYQASIEQAQEASEPGTGYFQVDWRGEEIKPAMHALRIKNPNKTIAWGSMYWQYFEDLDQIQPYEDTPLQIKKQLYKWTYTDKGPVLTAINQATLTPGDQVTVRIELQVDRDMEYIHMKDMRASGFEPINVLSRYKWQGGLGYYESTKDLATHFFFDRLPKGTYVFEYPLRVVHAGHFSNGITTVQSMYAPEFGSHSEGVQVEIRRHSVE